MAMGSFNRKRQYKQQNPMANAAAMLGLLKQQNDSLGQVGDAVELQGQNMGRQKVAELMGTDEYQNATPEQAQALMQAKTGGRRLGESGDKTLKSSYDTKQKVLDNENKVTAAELLNSNQLNRDAINNKAAYGNSNELLKPAQLAEKQETIRQYETALKDKTIDDATRSRLRQEKDTIAAELVMGSKKKPSNFMIEDLLGIKKGTNKSGDSIINYSKGTPYKRASPVQRQVINHPKLNGLVSEGKDGVFYVNGRKLDNILARDLLNSTDLND